MTLLGWARIFPLFTLIWTCLPCARAELKIHHFYMSGNREALHMVTDRLKAQFLRCWWVLWKQVMSEKLAYWMFALIWEFLYASTLTYLTIASCITIDEFTGFHSSIHGQMIWNAKWLQSSSKLGHSPWINQMDTAKHGAWFCSLTVNDNHEISGTSSRKTKKLLSSKKKYMYMLKDTRLALYIQLGGSLNTMQVDLFAMVQWCNIKMQILS